MKKLILSRLLVAVAFVAIFVIACKKEKHNDQDILSDAKKWYEKTTANAVVSLQSNKQTVRPIRQSVEWNSAKLFKLEDGTDVVAAPISVKTGAGAVKGSFVMLLAKQGDSFGLVVAYDKKSGYLTPTVSDAEIQALYKKALDETALRKKIPATNQAKLSGVPPGQGGGGQVCTDWYWTTTVYDQYGQVMSVTETYAYTTCTGDGGGGGATDPTDPTDPDPNCQASQDVIAGESVSINVGSEVGAAVDGNREGRYRWVPFRNVFGLWKFISTEKSREVKAGDEWWFEKLEHLSLKSDGIMVGAEVEYEFDDNSETVLNKTEAAIRHHYHYTGSLVCKDFPIKVTSNGTVDSPKFVTSN